MYTIKTPAFLRPNSRPSSPAPTPPPSRPDSGIGFDRGARPLNRLSLSTFRRPSPAPVPASSAVPAPLIQDGSYLEMLSLKFNEAIAKALAQPTGAPIPNEVLAGRRPIPAGRGHALGAVFASELFASRDNPHLYRAIIRCLQRPLSVLLTNLSTHLVPLLASPEFHSPSAPTVQAPSPNPTQSHALALATFAGELLEKFDELGLGKDAADTRGDGMKSIREGLLSTVARVVNPLVSGIRNELLPIIEALERPSMVSGKAHNGLKSSVLHPSIVTLQAIVPIYARNMSRYCATLTSQATLATFLLCVIWRALIALSHRPYNAPETHHHQQQHQQQQQPQQPPVSPPVTPNRFTMRLPPSRPPTPPAPAASSTASVDASALYDLLLLFPRPDAEKEATRHAREAVDEAYDALKALAALLKAVHGPVAGGGGAVDEGVLERLTGDIPTLVALPVLLQALLPPAGRAPLSVAAALGMGEEDYRGTCLPGFSRAEECAGVVGHRVLDALLSGPSSSSADVVTRWLEAEVDDANSLEDSVDMQR